MSFLDEELARLYESDSRVGKVSSLFAFLALFVATIGLYGLVSYAAERRTREIAVRKVLGASVPSVVTLILREFVVLVALAGLVACPLAYYFMSRWLENFAFRIDLNVVPFALSLSATVAVATAAICYQAMKAAATNPVDSLRSE
jgi:putative ABC transport system permease protein